MSNKTGLFVDSFPIFHRGHELCMKYAQHEVDELIVLIFNDSNAEIPLPIRTNWIKQLYPDVEVIESWFDFNNDGATTLIQKQFLDRVLKGREITHLYSTDFGTEHLCEQLNIKNRINPSIRNRINKVTDNIRQNSYANIANINPLVYRELITNIAFVGAQSTGKSTITEALAKRFNTQFMFEYGRYHWDVYQKDRIETISQIEEITERQLQMEEDRLRKANKYFFTDTCPFVTLRYAYDWHGTASEKLLKYAQEAQTRYDLIFLCGDDIPYADTPERDGIEQRTSFQSQIRYELLSRKIPFIELTGSLEERIKTVEGVLKNYKKYSSIGNNIIIPKEKQSYR